MAVGLTVFDRIKETTTITGTGSPLTLLGAVPGFKAFSDRYATNDVFPYAIVGQGASEWEVGLGYLSGSTSLVRDTVTASSNSDALVSFSSGTKDIFVTMNALTVKPYVSTGRALLFPALP